MADALCGPSNAVQNFQKHTSVDRTLQQDRLTTRQSPVQGFRSQDPNAGILDPEFAAFEAGFGSGPTLPELYAPTPFAQRHAPLPQFPQVENPGWASDFQQLQISQPSPIPQHQFRAEAPLHRSSPGGWHAEFMRQQKAPMAQQRVESMTSQFQNVYGFEQGMPQMMGGGFDQLNGSSNSQQYLNHQSSEQNFDDAAFNSAFEQASADAFVDEVSRDAEEAMIHDAVTEVETQRIGADTIPAKDQSTIQTQPEDSEELAKTAGALLASVKHDQSQKFQESNFLSLMRRLRDREVQVQGDEFKETTQSLHPGGQFYPEEYHEQHATHQPTVSQHSLPKTSHPYGYRSTETTMTGAITGEDIAKFDDVNSCGFPARMGTGTAPDERKVLSQEELMVKELNEETEAMRRVTQMQSDSAGLQPYQVELLDEEAVYNVQQQLRPGT